MMRQRRFALSSILVVTFILAFVPVHARAQGGAGFEFRVLATSKTSTMEKELNDAAQAGYRFQTVMGGETAIGGKEVVVVLSRVSGASARFQYRLLATNRTSTMERELQQAAESGYEYRGQTVFETLFGGKEVVCILERDGETKSAGSSYRLLATTRTSTLEKELRQAGTDGYQIVGLTVGKTAMGGNEVIAIMRRESPRR